MALPDFRDGSPEFQNLITTPAVYRAQMGSWTVHGHGGLQRTPVSSFMAVERVFSFTMYVNWNKQVMAPSLTYAGSWCRQRPRTSNNLLASIRNILLLMTSFAHLDTPEASSLVTVRSRQMPQTMLPLRLNHNECVCFVCVHPKGYRNAIFDG